LALTGKNQISHNHIGKLVELSTRGAGKGRVRVPGQW